MSTARQVKMTPPIWPRVIALREECFKITCSRCGVFMVSDTYCRHLGACPQCKNGAVSMVATGCFHYWSMFLRPVEGGVRVSEIAGPFDDPVEAMMKLSSANGLLCPVAQA